MGRDRVPGGHIDAQWGDQRVKMGGQHHPVAAVNIILPDGRDFPNLKSHAVIKGHGGHLFQCAADRLRGQGQIFQRCVQIHRCPVIQPDDGRHQHPAFQHKLIFVRGGRKANKKPLEHIVLQNDLCRDILLLGDIADFRFQAHGIAHNSTSKYWRRTPDTRICRA